MSFLSELQTTYPSPNVAVMPTPAGGSNFNLDFANSGGPVAAPTPSAPQGGGGFFSNFLEGGQNSPLMTGLGAAQGLANLYFGFQNFKLAKDSFKESKRQFELNFGAQKKLTNSQLADRQRARVAANPGAYQGVEEYMNQNGIA